MNVVAAGIGGLEGKGGGGEGEGGGGEGGGSGGQGGGEGGVQYGLQLEPPHPP